jgi:hypothetical protein
LLLACCAGGCSDKTSTSYLVNPGTGRYALSGQVHLAGETTDDIGTSHGPFEVDDASGVRVWLLRPDGLVDSTVTRSGSFVFKVDDVGLYRAFAWVIPFDTVAAANVTVDTTDEVFPTLEIGHFGNLLTYPNPFGAMGVGIEFTPVDSQRVYIDILDLKSAPVWTYHQDIPPVYYHVHWIGTDNHDQPTPVGYYWAVARHDGGIHYNLVHKE